MELPLQPREIRLVYRAYFAVDLDPGGLSAYWGPTTYAIGDKLPDPSTGW